MIKQSKKVMFFVKMMADNNKKTNLQSWREKMVLLGGGKIDVQKR